MTPAEAKRSRLVTMLLSRRALGVQHRRRRMPRQQEPKLVRTAYALELLGYLAKAQEILRPLLEELPALAASAARSRGDSARRADAGEGRRVRELVEAAAATLGELSKPEDIEALAHKFATRTATYQRIQLDKQVKATLGADVFIGDQKLQALTSGFVTENVALIKDLPAKLYGQIEVVVSRGLAQATPHHQIAAELEEKFALSRDRARLIARDQVGKLYGQINAARQQDLGVTHFFWRTVNDSRVRDEHTDRAEYEGNGAPGRYAYDDPPDGELPGEPINCRCTAEPDFSGILGNL